MCSGTTSGSLGEPYALPGVELGLAMYRATMVRYGEHPACMAEPGKLFVVYSICHIHKQ